MRCEAGAQDIIKLPANLRDNRFYKKMAKPAENYDKADLDKSPLRENLRHMFKLWAQITYDDAGSYLTALQQAQNIMFNGNADSARVERDIVVTALDAAAIISAIQNDHKILSFAPAEEFTGEYFDLEYLAELADASAQNRPLSLTDVDYITDTLEIFMADYYDNRRAMRPQKKERDAFRGVGPMLEMLSAEPHCHMKAQTLYWGRSFCAAMARKHRRESDKLMAEIVDQIGPIAADLKELLQEFVEAKASHEPEFAEILDMPATTAISTFAECALVAPVLAGGRATARQSKKLCGIFGVFLRSFNVQANPNTAEYMLGLAMKYSKAILNKISRTGNMAARLNPVASNFLLNCAAAANARLEEANAAKQQMAALDYEAFIRKVQNYRKIRAR
jgi:hypothetical protein